MSSDVSVRELISRANRLLASGKTAEARTVAQQAYALDPSQPDVLVLVSKVISDPAKQRGVLQRALQLDPTHREASERLAALDRPNTVASLPKTTVPPPLTSPIPTPPDRLSSPAKNKPSTGGRVTSRLSVNKRWLPLLGGAVILVFIVGIVVVITRRGGDTPDSVARAFMHALLTNDDTAALNALSGDSRAQTLTFCSPAIVACLARKIRM